ncbi:unconventional myosin-IXa-like isoform X1 [Histomonas meleagridis]|uniref:unconventional myosin-IXa-like isoform X1 n=1 Tax=Histomonas meleagridis TaxID=135588 RepID=UPI00355AC3C1|nr:unconventional myosin-IXa-like isoform X1 [Histomonas meleagridis]KAH0801226.1 unconventional myosin-IXa-like isoform X1 [Histomonas meleagridis]
MNSCKSFTLTFGLDTKVSEVIQNSLKKLNPNLDLDPSQYGIYVLPQQRWLYPKFCICDYINSYQSTPINVFQIMPYSIISITVTAMQYKKIIRCDEHQRVRDVINLAIKEFIQDDEEFFSWPMWVLSSEKEALDMETSVKFLEDKTLFLRRSNFKNPTSFANISVFKRPLIDVISRDENSTGIPQLFEDIITKIESYSEIEGIFRKSGLQVGIDNFISQIDSIPPTDKERISQLIDQQSPHDLASILKTYLRNLPEPLIPSSFYASLRRATDLPDPTFRVPLYKVILKTLPEEHFSLLRRITQCLYFISTKSDKNKMAINNLCICFAPCVFMLKLSNQLEALNEQKYEQTIFTDLITYQKFIFSPDPTSIKVLPQKIKCIQQNEKYKIEEGKEYNVLRINNNENVVVNINDESVEVPLMYFEKLNDIISFDNWIMKSSEKLPNCSFLKIDVEKTNLNALNKKMILAELEKNKETVERLEKLVKEMEDNLKQKESSCKAMNDLIEKSKNFGFPYC